MKNWQNTLIHPSITLREALQTINDVGCQMVLVIDIERRLLGTLSDGDARRALLRGLTLDDPASEAMYQTPTVAHVHDDRATRLGLMKRQGLHQLPIIDSHGHVVGLEVVDDYLHIPAREEAVVIMAGGLGSRLKELTHATPKPMLNVGSRPILETIVRSFSEQGFRRFYLAVNYKAEQIEAHFGDGSRFDIEIQYLREKKRMGTAGALSLLPTELEQPIVVTNADLLTKADYGAMLEKHLATGADATMAVRKYEMQVPFGVIQEKDGRIFNISEKPVHQFIVSAGMYVLSPHVLKFVPRDQFFDMPMLFETITTQGLFARCHHVDGYWLDIGQPSDFERANHDFHEVFR
ncbi:nucleotidyltransferase family protein [Chromobacterium amazonense]|uniref:Nucleotidyltransferase family protein n=1 Tax=Chromobacterium amazonense TaxID=1382803 RepID=A0ABU8V172_9NEIS|nr:nucleotidyltransferase family protein [Chromobacterium amazonense]MDQ4542223.1 nucleotidyltransferase family protein [Chromobacterium amazonense]